MNLGRLIEGLRAIQDQNAVVPIGFGRGASYRGYYEDLAFEPKTDVTIASMLEHSVYCIGNYYTGRKGGRYRMDLGTRVWIAELGDYPGEEITEEHLEYWALQADGTGNQE